MKENYENRFKTKLIRRTPCIIRLDGKAFHTFARGFVKPFDEVLAHSMWDTTLNLCKNVEGCVLGYTQSDEITLVLVDYKTIDCEAYFDYSVEKLCSITASMATLFFNKALERHISLYKNEHKEDVEYEHQLEIYTNAANKGALFDSRCFNIPIDEVTNCVLWRQKDAERNSVLSVAQWLYSHKELQGLSCEILKEKMLAEKKMDWNSLPTAEKLGVCCIRDMSNAWAIDTEIPRFIGEGRNYIEKLINFNEE